MNLMHPCFIKVYISCKNITDLKLLNNNVCISEHDFEAMETAGQLYLSKMKHKFTYLCM